MVLGWASVAHWLTTRRDLAWISLGRTGRFGRKGISINFVHDKATWQQMEQIEKQTGKQIVRIETNDLDAMEEVRPRQSRDIPPLPSGSLNALCWCWC